MPTVAEYLSQVPFLRSVPSVELRRIAPAFTKHRLAAGEVLWKYGEPALDMAILVEGDLIASANGKDVGRAKAPDLVGEAGAFIAGALRTATLSSDTGTTVLILNAPDLRALRFAKSAAYECFLEYALRALIRRVSATSREIAKFAVGDEERVVRTEPSVLVKLWRAFRQEKPGPCPPLPPLLRQLPGLAQMDPELEAAFCASFEARAFAEGEVVVLEGEPGDFMYIVADGDLDVLRDVRGDKAELLTKLRSGQTFGANTMIETGPRTASCVGISPGWLYRMDKSAYDALRGETRIRWNECILATLASQIRNANGSLAKALRSQDFAAEKAQQARANAGQPPTTADLVRTARAQGHKSAAGKSMPETEAFAELLKASGFLESLPTEESTLENLTVTYDTKAKRRKK